MRRIITITFTAMLLCLTACGGAESNGNSDKVVTGDKSANLPLDVPLIAGATIVHNNNGVAGSKQTNATAILTSTESVNDVYKHYSKALKDTGFKITREVKVEKIRTITGTKKGVSGMITVKPDGKLTQIMIVRRDEP